MKVRKQLSVAIPLRWLTSKTNEEVRNINNVGGISSSVVVHLVCLPRLILDHVQKNVDRRIRVLWRGSIS